MLRKIIASLLVVVLLAASITVNGLYSGTKAEAADTDFFDDLDQNEIVLDMGAGWNLGNQMEGNINGTPSETAWCSTKVTAALLQAVADAGFKSVRIPCSYLSKIGAAPDYTINAAWLKRIGEVVDYAIDADLYVIINVHGDGYHTVTGGWLLMDGEDQETIRTKFSKVWEQIAVKFRDYDEHLIFESMNEVFDGSYGTPPSASYSNLNTLNQIFVDTVRQTGGNNAKRWLLVPGWNTNIDYTVGNYGFQIPTDDYRDASITENRIMISVHYYDPWEFALREDMIVTQWGSIASNSSLVASWGGESYMKNQLKKCYDAFVSKGYPVVIGEYGTVDKDNEVYRAHYAKMLCKYAKQYGCVPVLWDNAWNGDYGMAVFNRSTRKVTQQAIVDGIMSVYDVPAEALSLNTDSLYFEEAGQNAELTANAEPYYTNDTVRWSSSDSSVAVVSDGVVTAVGGGTAVITATCGSVSAECTVTVRVPATGIEFAEEQLIIALGDTVTPSVRVLPENTTDSVSYVLVSSDGAVLSVSDLSVTGTALGEAVLTASAADFTAQVSVTVTSAPREITLSEGYIEIEKRGSVPLPEVSITPADSAFPVVWESSDSSVAYIENGYIYALSKGNAVLTAGFGDLEAQCSVTVLDTFPETIPTLTAASGGYNSIALSWEPVDDAVQYEVWISTSANGTYTLKAAVDGTETSYINTGRTTNKTYYYKLRALNEYGEYTQYSEVVSAKALPAQVQNAKAARASYNSIKISWSKVSGASGYVVYRATAPDGTYSAVKTITSGSTVSYTNGSLTCGKTYYYKVRAYRTVSGKKVYGDYSEVVSAYPYLTKPTVTVSKSSYYLTVKWNKIGGATGYKVYRSTDPEGEFTLIKTITSGSTVSMNNTSVVPGVTYYYKVVATRGSAASAESAVKSATPTLAKPTSVLANRSSYNAIKTTWKKVTGASGYVIYRSDASDGEFIEIARVSGSSTLSYNDVGVDTGKSYYYKVAAYRTSGGLTGIGTISAADPGKATLGTVSSFTAKRNSYDSVKLTWKQLGGADGYYIYRATSKSGTYTQHAKVEGGDVLSFIDDDLVTGKYYYYKVKGYRIVNGEEVLSASYTAYKSARGTLSTPVVTAKKIASGKAQITVKPIDGADGYYVYRSTSKSGKYTNVTAKCTQTTDENGNIIFTYAGQTKGKTYYYKVRAYHVEDSGNVYSAYCSYKACKV